MDTCLASPTPESLNCEDDVRLHCEVASLHDKLRHGLEPAAHLVVGALVQSFRIPESGIGLVALAEATIRDLASLKTIAPQVAVPVWSNRIGTVIQPLKEALGTDASRDLSALRNLPRQPLRNYLAPLGQGIPVPQIRLLHAIRGLLTLIILSAKEELTTDLAEELARWLRGKLPDGLGPSVLTQHALAQLAANDDLSVNTVKLLNQIASALRSDLSDPYDEPAYEPSWIATPSASHPLEQEDANDEKETDEAATKLDILADCLAQQATATRRMFAGIVTSRELHPFEVDLAFPRILALSGSNQSDEVFAAETAFHLGIMPSQYHLFPVRGDGNHGYKISPEGTGACLDLNQITGQSADTEAAGNRTVTLPLPSEFSGRLQSRLAKYPAANTYDQLFAVPMPALQRSTRSMLRSISVSSHRVTLTRLARTRGRYVLQFCRDEAYSALIGLNFLLGTTANFNYLTVRADRLKSILRECYRRIGYAGDLSTEDIQDVTSPHLANPSQVSALLTRLTTESATLIASLPKHCRINRLLAAHARITSNIYTLTKFLSASRPVEIETVTRSQVDLEEALAGVTDKRISPYHELRFISLPAYLLAWLDTYTGWLRLVAYRLSGINPKQAALIDSAAESENPEDRHPLFFFLSDNIESVPIGSRVLASALASEGIASNGGRHWVDSIARDAHIDSAAIMGQAGRGNPGQELFGRWSGATPAIALSSVSQAIDQRLEQLDLPPAPRITPRTYQGSGVPKDAQAYLPKLLETDTDWMKQSLPRGIGAPEPCPFSRSTAAHAASFPRVVRQWHSSAPPPGWLGVALSLILEDGVVRDSELLGALAEIAAGTIYQSFDRVFVDSNTRSLGIRRTDLSTVTLQLARRIPEDDDVPTTLASLDAAMRVWSEPDDAPLSISSILAKAEAYGVLHFPAAVSAWARGTTFARTTRPATVARDIYDCIEPPSFDLRRRARSSTAPGSVAEALAYAKAKQQAGASHETALSFLHQALEKIRTDGCDTLFERIEVGYLQGLAGSLTNLNTLLRYESGARNFVYLAADAIEQSGADAVDWTRIVDASLIGRQNGSAPDIAAINLVLRWLGIDLHIHQRSAAPPSALSYAEIVSMREVTFAITLLYRQQHWLGDDFHLAGVALRLLARHPLRWDSLAHLRLCDLALENATPHLVITEEAGANLKSDNAIRVIRLIDLDLVGELKQLAELRRARFPRDNLVAIFGDATHPRSLETAKRIHRLITDALWHATGSPVICVHDLRHRVITDRIHALLSPNAHLQFDTLKLRQGLIECAVEAGHSWPQVSMENYGHDMERLRTQHYRAWLAELPPQSDTFIAALTGVHAATLRKRRSRDPGYKPDLAEGFAWDDFRPGAAIVPLVTLVASNQHHVPQTSEEHRRHTHTPRAVYVGLRLLGDAPEIARAVSGLAIEQAQRIDLALAAAPQRLGAPLRARDDINRQTFLDSVLDSELAVAMSIIHPERSSIARIERSLQSVGDEWVFASPQDAIELVPWIQTWAANGISTEFLLRPCARSVVNSGILGEARCGGFSPARTLAARHFGRGVSTLLRFYPRPDTATSSTRVRASPQSAFLVSACVLAILYDPPEKSNVQEIQTT